MAKLLDVLVSMFGTRSSAQHDMLTYAKTEYKQDWRFKYDQLMTQYQTQGAWKK